MIPVSILLGGDIIPTFSNYNLFKDGNIKALIEEKLYSYLLSVDFRVFNLEGPLTDVEKPISKSGPNLIAPSLTINGIKLLQPSIIGLANNHILDQDEQGLFQTMELLSKHDINYIGAGRDLSNASIPVILEKEGIKIGIYACAENEFSIAEEKKAGANPFDPLESPDHIVKLKSNCDFVIVLYHGGKEYYRFPSPNLQKVCRKMSEKGADLIICQHSHCVGSYENYRNSVILYGQGNFLFDRKSDEFWDTSLLVKATFGSKMSIDFIPICKSGNGVAFPSSNSSDSILEAFHKRSDQISDPGFIEAEYEKFCIGKGDYYLSVFAGFGRIPRKINKLLHGKITQQVYSPDKLNMLQNYIECETHRELVLKYLRLKRKRKS
jgi:hypothetical protein